MFERLDARAGQVVSFAAQEARALAHNYIGTEHLLLGLLREEEGVAGRALASLDVTHAGVREQVLRIVGRGENVDTNQIPFTPRAKKVFELALREASSLGEDHVGTEHVLLALVREGEGVAMQILLAAGVTADAVREAVGRALPDEPPRAVRRAGRSVVVRSPRKVVLCYHAVSPTWEHRLSMPLARLLRQVRTAQRIARVHVTFDDAFRNIEPAVDALLARGLPVTIFVCTGFADRDGAPLAIAELAGDDPKQLATMTWDDLRRMHERGARVQAHSVSHAHLPTLPDGELERELRESKRRIEEELGGECVDFAYPYGERDERVRAAVRAAGYERAYALGAKRGDPYDIPRVDLYRRHGVGATLLKVLLPYSLRARLHRP